MAGNGPIIIDKATGVARIGTSAVATDDQVPGIGILRWFATSKEHSSCPVCGFGGLYESPWNNDVGSDEICPCCGTHFGYDDAATNTESRQQRHTELRQQWKLDGFHWFSRTRQPPSGWDPDDQLRDLRD